MYCKSKIAANSKGDTPVKKWIKVLAMLNTDVPARVEDLAEDLYGKPTAEYMSKIRSLIRYLRVLDWDITRLRHGYVISQKHYERFMLANDVARGRKEYQKTENEQDPLVDSLIKELKHEAKTNFITKHTR